MLLGDAGHATSPSLGQGCNAALEDVMILDKVLEECGGNLAAVPEEFNRRRSDDVLALVWLDKHARAMRGQQGILHPCLYMYLSHMYLRPTLARIFPAIEPPAMTRLWSEPVTYTTVKRAMIKDGALLGLVVLLLLVAVLGVALCPEIFKWWEMVTAGLVAGYSILMGSGMSE